MWWCCGKTKQNAKGCKFQKHVQKEDLHNSDSEEEELSKIPKCALCGQTGHKAHECDRDPNLRTGYDHDDEFVRIKKIAQAEKKMNDNFTLTEQLLKRMSLLSNDRITNSLLAQDDFNYNWFNKKIFDLDLPIENISEKSAELDDNDDEDSDAASRISKMSPERVRQKSERQIQLKK